MSILAVCRSRRRPVPAPSPYVVGGLALVILFGALLALLSIGDGREHS